MNENYLHSDLSSKIINVFYKVYNSLGYGFLEKVYQNSMMIELQLAGLQCRSLQPIDVYYQQQKVGFYVADIIVEDKIIVEIKAAEIMCSQHEAQLINYLKATNIKVGLLLNFGEKPGIKRKVFFAVVSP